MTLEQFADIIGVNLTVTYYANQNGRFCVHFENAAIKEPGLLFYCHGNGTSYREAVRDYIEAIKGRTLVIASYTPQRKEYNVPKEFIV